jgi:hypothetical protein
MTGFFSVKLPIWTIVLGLMFALTLHLIGDMD